MAIEPTYTTYPASEEHMPGNMEADNAQLESWMADVLNQDLLSADPNWDDFLNSSLDSGLSQPASAQYHSESLPDFPSDVYDSVDPLSVNPLTGADNFEFVNQFSNSTSFNFQPALPEQPQYAQSEDDAFATLTNSFPTSMPQPEDNSHHVFDQVASAFKDLARARAAADPRRISKKQKQRDATIALYLERLRDTCNEAVAMLASSNDNEYDTPQPNTQASSFNMSWQQSSAGGSTLSSPYETNLSSSRCSPESVPELSSGSQHTQDQSLPSPTASPTQPPVTGGVELVMDLNMNTATSLPRKHRRRTQAQRERYLAVRNQGACEKHKRQHKRCTCIDKVLAATPVQSVSAVESRTGIGRCSVAAVPSPHLSVSSSSESSMAPDRPLRASSHKRAVKLCPSGLAPTLNSGVELQQSANMKASGQFPTVAVSQSSEKHGVPGLPASNVKQSHPTTNLGTMRLRPERPGQHGMGVSEDRNPNISSQQRPSRSSRVHSSIEPTHTSSGVDSGTFTHFRQRPVSGVGVRDAAHNNEPVLSYNVPMDSRSLRHSTASNEGRFGFYLSSQQQRQQCNHTNSTYGIAAQPCDVNAGNVAYGVASLILFHIGMPIEAIPTYQRMDFHPLKLAYNWLCNRDKLGGQPHSFTLWCFIWISLLVMVNIFNGVFQ